MLAMQTKKMWTKKKTLVSRIKEINKAKEIISKNQSFFNDKDDG
jgi:hypothetical protein